MVTPQNQASSFIQSVIPIQYFIILRAPFFQGNTDESVDLMKAMERIAKPIVKEVTDDKEVSELKKENDKVDDDSVSRYQYNYFLAMQYKLFLSKQKKFVHNLI